MKIKVFELDGLSDTRWEDDILGCKSCIVIIPLSTQTYWALCFEVGEVVWKIQQAPFQKRIFTIGYDMPSPIAVGLESFIELVKVNHTDSFEWLLWNPDWIGEND